nr:uncharacterized protein LOC109192332 isoform X2 [Ipomoea batatas]
MATNTCEFGTIVDHQKGRYQCNYCGKVVSDVHRLKCHLGGVSGGVTHCLQVPEDVKEMLRTELLGKRFGNAMRNVGELNEPNLPLKRNRQDSPARLDKQDSIQNSGNVIAPVVPRGRVDSPAEGSGVGVNDSSLRKAQKSIGRQAKQDYDCQENHGLLTKPKYPNIHIKQWRRRWQWQEVWRLTDDWGRGCVATTTMMSATSRATTAADMEIDHWLGGDDGNLVW